MIFNTYGRSDTVTPEMEKMHMTVSLIFESFINKYFIMPKVYSQKRSQLPKDPNILRLNVRSAGSIIFHLFSQYIVKNVPYTLKDTRATIEATKKRARLDIDLPDGDPELANREKDEETNFVFYDDAIKWKDLEILMKSDKELQG